MAERPFWTALLRELNKQIGDTWTIKRIVYRPEEDTVDLSGIDKRTALILWGDERSRHFPEEYFRAAGAVIKCYCPETWEARGIIPVTDIAMSWTGDGKSRDLIPCSQRPYNVFFSGNLNYRRTDLFRGCSNRSFGWPFRISACYPTTGKYLLMHKVEAVVMYWLVRHLCHVRDFSHLYADSFIQFNSGFSKGLSPAEYLERTQMSKIVWCAPGFMTNETCRLIEASCAGCVCVVGRLPNNDIYRGNPFVRIDDWRDVRRVTDDLLKNTDGLDRIGCACREWYLSHFSPSAQAERIANLVQMRSLP